MFKGKVIDIVYNYVKFIRMKRNWKEMKIFELRWLYLF